MNRKTLFILMIVLLLLFTMAMDAAAYIKPLIADSMNLNLPIIFNQNAPLITAPPGTLAVFSSTATTSGNAGGRTAMNAICRNEDPDAHFCTLMEIENAFLSTGVFFAAPFSEAWVDKPYQLGSIIADTGAVRNNPSDWLNRNCLGWASDQSGEIANVITDNAEGTLTGILDCSLPRPVTCCKWGP